MGEILLKIAMGSPPLPTYDPHLAARQGHTHSLEKGFS